MQTKHEKTKIDEFVAKGYTASYKLEDDKLKDLSTGKSFSHQEVEVEEEFRYEGMSNPDDMSILLIITTKDGGKGTLLLPYGPMADAKLVDFFLKVSSNKNEQN